MNHSAIITITPFKSEDLPAILTLFREAVHAINKKDYTQEQLDAWAPQHINTQKWLHNLSNNVTYVAKKNGTIVGFADMTQDGYLDHLYIHKDHQGGLISLKLFKAIEQEARKRGLKKITTDCSITAKKPAERMGFVVIKEQSVEKSGVTFTNYALQKLL